MIDVIYRYHYVFRSDLFLVDEDIFESLFLQIKYKVYKVLNANCQESIAKYYLLLNRINDENVNLIIETDQHINYLNIDTSNATDQLNTCFVSLIGHALITSALKNQVKSMLTLYMKTLIYMHH